MQGSDTALLETILRAIVDKPEKVAIERSVDEMGVLFLVRLDEKDAGAVIGKGGSTIAAIRKIMGIVGMKNNARLNIKLDVPLKRKSSRYEKPSIEGKNHNSGEL